MSVPRAGKNFKAAGSETTVGWRFELGASGAGRREAKDLAKSVCVYEKSRKATKNGTFVHTLS